MIEAATFIIHHTEAVDFELAVFGPSLRPQDYFPSFVFLSVQMTTLFSSISAQQVLEGKPVPPPVSPYCSGRPLSSSGSSRSVPPFGLGKPVSTSGSCRAVRPQLLQIKNQHDMSEV